MSTFTHIHQVSAGKSFDKTEEENAFLESRPRTGVLTVHSVECRGMNKKKVQGHYIEIFQKPLFADPNSIYIHRAFSGGNDKGERIWKSEVKPINHVPKWDGDLKASFDVSQATTMKLEVWGKNRLQKDLFMGYVFWTARKVGQLQRESKCDAVSATMELSGDEKSEVAGTVNVILSWRGKEPEPEPEPEAPKQPEKRPEHKRSPSQVEPEERDPEGRIRIRWKVIHKSPVNVRSEPSFTAPQVGTLAPEDVVNEIEQRDGWIKHSLGWSIISSSGVTLLWKYGGR